MFKVHNKRRKGFSLVELIIVIAILGILTGILVVNAGNFTHPAKVRAWDSSIAALKDALMIYASTHGDSYPTLPAGDAQDVNVWLTQKTINTYIDKPIKNPFWPNAKVGIVNSNNFPTNAVDQPEDPGTDIVAWLSYTTSSATDIDGNTIANGVFTIRYVIGGKNKIISSTGANPSQ